MRSGFFVLATRSEGRRCRSIVDRSDAKPGYAPAICLKANAGSAGLASVDAPGLVAPAFGSGATARRKRRPQLCMD